MLACHVREFLERFELEEDIEMQAVVLRYLVTQGCEHVFLSGILRQNMYSEYIEQDFLLQSRGLFGHWGM